VIEMMIEVGGQKSEVSVNMREAIPVYLEREAQIKS
jgi:hypothetical protein